MCFVKKINFSSQKIFAKISVTIFFCFCLQKIDRINKPYTLAEKDFALFREHMGRTKKLFSVHLCRSIIDLFFRPNGTTVDQKRSDPDLVMMTYIRSLMSLTFGQIRPWVTELAALERLNNRCCNFFPVAIYMVIFNSYI